jgi:hypothetical protein
MSLSNFINKYSSLCDKNHHLRIYIGKSIFNGCFNNNLSLSHINNIINYCNESNMPILFTDKGQIAIYSNEFLYINSNNIIEYTTIDTFIDNSNIIKFASISNDHTTGSFINKPNNMYDYEMTTIELLDGCNMEIIKKFNNTNDINSISFNIIITIYKPCDILNQLNKIHELLNL